MKILSILVILGLMIGCKVKTPNGEVPEEYLEAVDTYVGEYTGVFGEKVEGLLTVSMEKNRPVLTFKGAQGEGLLGAHCESHIGRLESLSGSKKLKRADFSLDHNCAAEGDILSIRTLSSGKIELSVLARTRIGMACVDREVPLEDKLLLSVGLLKAKNVDIPDVPHTEVCYETHVGVFTRR